MTSSIKNVRPDIVAGMLARLHTIAVADSPAAELARLLLLPLEREDSARGSNLAETLRAYYACGARVDKTADAIFLHRNSVRYRLDRVRSLLGLDIDQPHVIAALTVALTCRDRGARADAEYGSTGSPVAGPHAN
jgi:PucR family transcriptional regulator, purine catabolism regulatory protein